MGSGLYVAKGVKGAAKSTGLSLCVATVLAHHF